MAQPNHIVLLYMEGIDLVRSFARTVIPNVNPSRVPKEINVSFDGGAFNGFYGLGVGLYLKELEASGMTVVKKVSGVSAGSMLALWYILEKPKTDINRTFVEMADHFNTHHNLRIYKRQVRRIVKDNFATDNLSILDDRLFISYYDIKECCRVTVSKYTSRKHLVDTIVQSSHIPFIVTKNMAYKNRYIDGMRPTLFDAETRTLFVKLTTMSKLARMFYTGTEVNMFHRVIIGIADANDFFTTGNSDMCSFVDEWSTLSKLGFYCRELGLCILYYLVTKICANEHCFAISTAISTAIRHVPWRLVGQEHFS